MGIKASAQYTITEINEEYSVVISNESHVFRADKDNTVVAASTSIQIYGYQGSTQIATKIGTITGLPSAGMTATRNNNNSTNTSITISVTTDLTSSIANNGTLTIPITVGNKTINKVFSWSKAQTGATGNTGPQGPSARTYWITSNVNTITRSMSKTLTPSTITFNSYYRDGNSANAIDYSGRFIIQESANGTSWITKYTSNTNESSKTYTPTNTTNLVKCTMYVAGGTSTALDSVTVGIIDSIDDLQVGGRNILPYSSMREYFGGSLRDINYYSIDNNKIIATNQPKSGPLPGWKIDVIENQQFTVSGSTDLSLVQFYMKGFDNDNNQVFEQRGNGSIGVTNSNFKYTFSISNAPNVSYIHLGVGSVSVANYWIKPKLEKGNVATDWSPASEDIESNISDK